MELLNVTVPGDPQPKKRPRVLRTGRTYTPKETQDAEQRIRDLAETVWAKDPYDGEVGITVTFYCATRRRTDGDNMLKLVTDALQRGKNTSGGVILDDAQILEWHARVFRRADGQEPRTIIRLYTLD